MIDQLEQRFKQSGVRFFRRGQLVMVEIANACGRTVVSTRGATVLSYVPSNGREVLWVSETARYDGSKAVRGGIPVCWPWFGPHPDHPDLPAHGFARHATWDLVECESGDKLSRAVFRLESSAETRRVWPWAFRLELVVTLADTLTIELHAHNLSEESWTVSEALHSYFRVDDARGLSVDGLDGLAYWDKQQGGVRGTQERPLKVDPPVDRVFFGHVGDAVLHDRERDIRVGKRNSATTVVWNPGPQGVRTFDDIPDDAWRKMLCVETANAIDNRYRLAPGDTHTLSATIHAEPTAGNG